MDLMSCKKRYLMVLTDLNMGGVTTAAINFCNGLIARGNAVDVLVMSEVSSDATHRFADAVRILRLDGKDRLWDLGLPTIRRCRNPIKKLGLLLLGILKAVANKQSKWIPWLFGRRKRLCGYDIAIAYRQCSPCYYFVLNCVEAEKKAAFIHGDVDYMGDISTWEKYLSDFDTVAFVSDAVKKKFLLRRPDLSSQASTVYNVFPEEEILQKAKMPYDSPFVSERLRLVSVLRMSNWDKGADRIPPICKGLKERFAGLFEWIVIGDGPDFASCVAAATEMGIDDHIRFMGALANPYPYMAQADVLVLPSVTEAFPLVVGEALSLHTPVIATDFPAVREILEDEKTGLIAQQSVEGLRNCLERYLIDGDLRQRLAMHCCDFRYNNDRSYYQLMEALYHYEL